jgi:hypothetical protein
MECGSPQTELVIQTFERFNQAFSKLDLQQMGQVANIRN